MVYPLLVRRKARPGQPQEPHADWTSGTAWTGMRALQVCADDSSSFHVRHGDREQLSHHQQRPPARRRNGKCSHYTHWQTDFDLLEDLNIHTLRYGPPIHTTWLEQGRYEW